MSKQSPIFIGAAAALGSAWIEDQTNKGRLSNKVPLHGIAPQARAALDAVTACGAPLPAAANTFIAAFAMQSAALKERFGETPGLQCNRSGCVSFAAVTRAKVPADCLDAVIDSWVAATDALNASVDIDSLGLGVTNDPTLNFTAILKVRELATELRALRGIQTDFTIPLTTIVIKGYEAHASKVFAKCKHLSIELEAAASPQQPRFVELAEAAIEGAEEGAAAAASKVGGFAADVLGGAAAAVLMSNLGAVGMVGLAAWVVLRR